MKSINEDQHWGLTPFTNVCTGLDVEIYICDVVFWKSDKSLNPRSPVIIINNSTRTSKYLTKPVFISVSKKPHILEDDQEIVVSSKKIEEVFKWIVLNKELLRKHWSGKIDTTEFCENMVMLSGENAWRKYDENTSTTRRRISILDLIKCLVKLPEENIIETEKEI